MAETIKNKKEIIRCSINLIWEATNGGVRKIVFNDASRSATIFLTDGTKDIENLDATGVVLISEEIYQKIINDLANTIEDIIDIKIFYHSNRLLEVDELTFDTQTNENDTLNLEDDQWTKGSHMNDYFKISKRNEKNKQTENIRETDESMPNDQQSINITSRMLEQTTLANNSTQADDNGSIQDNNNEEDLDVSDDDSPGWSECEECYGNKKELCEHCGCS
ncbi:1976_t:CDS:2, partial [Dentiscutata heterogama]